MTVGFKVVYCPYSSPEVIVKLARRLTSTKKGALTEIRMRLITCITGCISSK